MKTLIAPALLFMMTAALTSNAQVAANTTKHKGASKKVRTEEISALTKDHFLTDFGNVTDVSWSRGPQTEEAVFTKDGKTQTAYYDYRSQLIGTTAVKSFSDLPANAQKDIQKHYKGYVTGPVVMFDDNEYNDSNMLLYGQEFEDKDNYFVELSKNNKPIVVQVNMEGQVFFFKQL